MTDSVTRPGRDTTSGQDNFASRFASRGAQTGRDGTGAAGPRGRDGQTPSLARRVDGGRPGSDPVADRTARDGGRSFGDGQRNFSRDGQRNVSRDVQRNVSRDGQPRGGEFLNRYAYRPSRPDGARPGDGRGGNFADRGGDWRGRTGDWAGRGWDGKGGWDGRRNPGWNGGNWQGGNWQGGNWYGGRNVGRIGFSPLFGFYPFGFGFGNPWWGNPWWGSPIGGFGWGGLGWGGLGWGQPYFGYNRFCGVGGWGGGFPSYGYYAYGYPYEYDVAYAGEPAAVVVEQVEQTEQPAIDLAAAQNSDFAEQGEFDFRAGDYAAAVRWWRHAIVDDPNNATLFLMMSQALFATGEYDEAAGALQQGLMRMPQEQWGVVVENYRELYAPNDDYSNQLKALEKSAKETPDDPARQVLLGYHYGYLGYPVQAVEKLNRTMELAPQDLMAQKLREVMAGKAAARGLEVAPAPALPDPVAVPAADAAP